MTGSAEAIGKPLELTSAAAVPLPKSEVVVSEGNIKNENGENGKRLFGVTSQNKQHSLHAFYLFR